MNAQLKPVQKTLLQTQLEAVQYYGAPGAHLEANEVPRWVEELGDTNMVTEFVQAVSDYAVDEKQWNRLLTKLMGDERDPGEMTVDELVEFRDLCRSRFLDYCIRVQQVMIDREMGLL